MSKEYKDRDIKPIVNPPVTDCSGPEGYEVCEDIGECTGYLTVEEQEKLVELFKIYNSRDKTNYIKD